MGNAVSTSTASGALDTGDETSQNTTLHTLAPSAEYRGDGVNFSMGDDSPASSPPSTPQFAPPCCLPSSQKGRLFTEDHAMSVTIRVEAKLQSLQISDKSPSPLQKSHARKDATPPRKPSRGSPHLYPATHRSFQADNHSHKSQAFGRAGDTADDPGPKAAGSPGEEDPTADDELEYEEDSRLTEGDYFTGVESHAAIHGNYSEKIAFPEFRKFHREDLTRRDISARVYKAIAMPAISTQVIEKAEYRDGVKVKKEVTREVSMKGGYIYFLQISGLPGYVKIGMTTKTPGERKSEHRLCGYILEPLDDSSFVKVPCVRRLENIIFLDLWNERLCFSCVHGKQTRVHDEWFAIDYQEALVRVMKWRDWMNRVPYGEDDLLAPVWQERIRKLTGDKEYGNTLSTELHTGELWKSFMEETKVTRSPKSRRKALR